MAYIKCVMNFLAIFDIEHTDWHPVFSARSPFGASHVSNSQQNPVLKPLSMTVACEIIIQIILMYY